MENVRETTAEDVKNDGERERRETREITEHFYDTEREKHVTTSTITDQRGESREGR